MIIEDEELRELYNRWMDELREPVNESYREEAQKEPDDNTRQAIYDLVKDGFFYDEWGKFKSGTELGDPQCMKILEPAHRDWENWVYVAIVRKKRSAGRCLIR